MWVIGESHAQWDGGGSQGGSHNQPVMSSSAWYMCDFHDLEQCSSGGWTYFDSSGPRASWKRDDDARVSTGEECAVADSDWDFISYNNHLHPIKFGTIDGTTLLIDSQIDEVEFMCFGVGNAEVFSGNAVRFCRKMLTFLVSISKCLL